MINIDTLIAGLGGIDNIDSLEPCVTRLRTEVRDPSKINRTLLKNAGCHGIFAIGNIVQVIVGPNADTIASDLETLTWQPSHDSPTE